MLNVNALNQIGKKKCNTHLPQKQVSSYSCETFPAEFFDVASVLPLDTIVPVY